MSYNNTGYPPQGQYTPGYNPAGGANAGYPPVSGGGMPYPPTAGGLYPATAGGPYPPTTGTPGGPYPPTTGGPYPPTTRAPGGAYPPTTGGPYPPTTGAPGGPYPPTTGGPYPPTTGAPSAPYYPPGTAAPNMQYPPPSNNPNAPAPTEKSPWNPNQATTYSGTDIASDDVNENDAEEMTAASAPSYDLVVSGYENLGSGASAPVGPPPAYDEITLVPATIDASRMPSISEDEARQALHKLVEKNTCWGSGAARDMKMNDIIAMCAYHYVFETFTEGRSTCSASVPYKGGYVDGPQNGHAPMPWDIPCSPSAFFKNEEHKLAVPHTDVVRPCHLCHGRGFNRCGKCRGRGMVRCGFCHGHGRRHVTNADGHRHHETCHSCHGHGRKRCLKCHGHGCVTCYVCQGYGSVKQFIQLTVLFSNRHSDHIIEKSDLPDELIRNVQGDTIFEQTQLRVGPIQNFFDQEINNKSKELVSVHSTAWPTERILQQRHYLRAVPVHECHFVFSGKAGRFWVYGHQREVYTKDYPHTCCCCQCTIL